MNDNETALKAACLMLAEKEGCPSDGHCYSAGHGPCDEACWECWQDYLLIAGAPLIEARMHYKPEDFVPTPRRVFQYEPEDINNILEATADRYKASWTRRLHATIKLELRKRELRYSTEAIIKRCNKSVLKAMPKLENIMDKLRRVYTTDEYDWEEDLDTDETPVGKEGDPFGD